MGVQSKSERAHPMSVMATMTRTELTEEQVQLIAKALADPRRYQILKEVGNCPGTSVACTKMLDRFSICASTMSHHMKELETAGLVRSEKDGKFVHYVPQPHVLRAYLDRLKSDLA
jgi:DNA-binding transcriptional ArsR family regulator